MSRDAIAAFVDVVCPGLRTDASAGAPDVAAERYVAHYLGEQDTTRLTDALGRIASLDSDGRGKLVADLRRDPSVRPLIDSAISLTIAAVYGSWSGRDPDGTLAREPLGWALARYPGVPRSQLDAMGG